MQAELIKALESRLTTKVRVVKRVYPTVEIGYWAVYYDPESVGWSSGQSLPWVARAASKMLQCDTLEHLVQAMESEQHSV